MEHMVDLIPENPQDFSSWQMNCFGFPLKVIQPYKWPKKGLTGVEKNLSSWWFQTIAASESIHAEILKVLVKVARYQPANKETGSYESPEETCPQPEVQPLTTTHVLSSKLIKMYGQQNMSHIEQWWQQVGERSLQSGGRLCWVSGLHLYIDFFWTTGFHGVISPKFGKWFSDPSELPGLSLNMSSRTTMFLRAWNAYMKDRGQHIPQKLPFPRSSVLAC